MTYRKEEKLKIIMAFRKYTRLGLSSEKLSPFVAYSRIKGCSRNNNEAYDLLAVYDTIRFLKILKKNEILRTVKAVYFADGKGIHKRNTVSLRVLRHAYETNCDERTIYRQLEYAKKLYSALRNSY